MAELSQELLDELEFQALNNEIATKQTIDQIKREYAEFRGVMKKYSEPLARNAYCHKKTIHITNSYDALDLKKALATLFAGVIMLQQENDSLKQQLNKE